MHVLNKVDITVVSGGDADKSSGAYKAGEAVGEFVKKAGEVLGFIGGCIMCATLAVTGEAS